MILDNKGNGKVIGELRQLIENDCKLSILSANFSIYAFDLLNSELKKTKYSRLIFSNIDKDFIKNIVGSINEVSLKNKLNQSSVAKNCLNWIKNGVDVRRLNSNNLNNFYHINGSDNTVSLTGSFPFTAEGIGAVKSDTQGFMLKQNDDETLNQIFNQFEGMWFNNSEDIKQELCEALDYLSENKTGSFIYFNFLYNIFKEFLSEIDEDSIIKSKTGFKDTVVWNKLYKFQKDGVIGAIDKIEKYNGCIIADSVGLGKTFEALAVIKYYELRNDRVLVLCPKKLRENWTVYTINDKRNLLENDRFNYDVLNHTDLNREKGKSGEINLESVNWGNYDLVVIDESHNFRNNNARINSITRYRRLMDYIIRSGVKTKVLMLSATPVNNKLNDLKNQVLFITEGRDSALKEFGINSIENTLKNSQKYFNQWLKESEKDRTVETLLDSLSFDYFKLLDLLTIARSRKHIEKYYDINDIGKFPERLKPKNIKADIDISGLFPSLREVNINIKKLSLASYSPLQYLRIDKVEEYSRKYDQEIKGGASKFRQVDRERSMIHLMRINLLKRMESSIYSFGLTVNKIKYSIENIISKINKLEEGEDVNDYSIADIETDDPILEDLLVGNKVKVLMQDIDLIKWKQDLEDDLYLLNKISDNVLDVTVDKDDKLSKLKNEIIEKANNPINIDNRKMIIFTAFSDTAGYLYENISSWAKQELGLNTAMVIGSGTNKVTLDIGKDLNSILTNFSPVSKEREKVYPNAKDEIDILIATDCISEGQNLQDCDMLINYDIHWNPVRIVQRFGRIDRLGSKNSKIKLVNFWPNMELDEYINLENRVSGRMTLLDVSATGEENIIDPNSQEMNDLEYRRKQMKQLQDNVIDLEDVDGSVSITDMTFNDFRMDLSAYLKENLTQLEKAPSGFNAVVSSDDEDAPAGVIFCLRDIHNKVKIDDNYSIKPYYVVYVKEDGEVKYNHLQLKKSLDVLKRLHSKNKEINEVILEDFNSFTKNGKDMSFYKDLLEKAIEVINGKSEEKGVESLFSVGGTNLLKDNINGIDDFEVMSYMIIRGDC